MPANTKTIKRRIKSVKNTKKITKAMELVSAAKMRRAVEAVQNSRAYAQLAWELLAHLSEIRSTVKLPLLAVRPVKKVLVVLMSSNRGLCGSFNSNIIKKTIRAIRENESRLQSPGATATGGQANADVNIIALGKKGGEAVGKQGLVIDAIYNDLSDTPKLDDVKPVIKTVIESFTNGKVDKVLLAYTDFKSAINQIPTVRQLLPLKTEELREAFLAAGIEQVDEIKEINNASEPVENVTESDVDFTEPSYLTNTKVMITKKLNDTTEFIRSLKKKSTDENEVYIFEPDRTNVLEMMLPRLVETQVYQAVLESSASEHSARMMAMRNASDAASEMIDDLNLNFNKARQAGITQEIAEIAGGAAALG
ncbi:MAG: F0F1 ATP synthase subunit gamma [Candidatus Magasanikbacteria bacterium]|nr:F0F1 ATP synthase subunit gamma [Candidatus Magasanikbacteria bacterium]